MKSALRDRNSFFGEISDARHQLMYYLCTCTYTVSGEWDFYVFLPEEEEEPVIAPSVTHSREEDLLR